MKANTTLNMKFYYFEKKIEEPYNEEDGYPKPIDSINPNTNEIMHIGILALCCFYNKNKSLPEINNKMDDEELFKIAKKILEEKENKKEFWINKLR